MVGHLPGTWRYGGWLFAVFFIVVVIDEVFIIQLLRTFEMKTFPIFLVA